MDKILHTQGMRTNSKFSSIDKIKNLPNQNLKDDINNSSARICVYENNAKKYLKSKQKKTVGTSGSTTAKRTMNSSQSSISNLH